MPNNIQTVATALGVLKELFQAPIVDQMNEELNLWRGLKVSKYKFTGSLVNRPMKSGRNPGIGSGTDNGVMPKIGSQPTLMAQILAKYNWLRFGITGPIIKASANDAGAFVRIVAFEMEEGLKDFMWDTNRQLGWDGAGRIGLISQNAVATTSLTVKGRSTGEPALKFLYTNMAIDIYSSAGVLKASNVTVNSVTGTIMATTATLTLDAAVTCDADDHIFRAGSRNNDIQGILTTYDGLTTTVYNIDRSTNINYQGNVIDKSSSFNTQLTLADLQQAQDTAEYAGGTKIKAVFSDYPSRAMYQKLLTIDKRYPNTVKGDGSFSSPDKNYLEWSGIPWVPDQGFAPNIMFIDDACFEKMIQCEFEWADETGSPLIAQTGVDAMEGRMRFFSNVYCNKPNGGTRILGYTSP